MNSKLDLALTVGTDPIEPELFCILCLETTSNTEYALLGVLEPVQQTVPFHLNCFYQIAAIGYKIFVEMYNTNNEDSSVKH